MLQAVGVTCKKLTKANKKKKKKRKNLDNITSTYWLLPAAGVGKQEALAPPSPRLFHKHMKTWRRLKAAAAPHMAGSRGNKGRLTSRPPIYGREAGRE